MLNKLLPILDRSTVGGEIRGFHPSSLGFNRFGRSMMLLRHFVSDGDDGAVRRGFVEVVVEVLEGTVCCLGVQEVDDGNECKIKYREHCGGPVSLVGVLFWAETFSY
jgi:hypothetical protein